MSLRGPPLTAPDSKLDHAGKPPLTREDERIIDCQGLRSLGVATKIDTYVTTEVDLKPKMSVVFMSERSV